MDIQKQENLDSEKEVEKETESKDSESEEAESSKNIEEIIKFNVFDLKDHAFHFGHNTKKLNPKMDSYVFGTVGNMHVIDISKTVPLFKDALSFLRKITCNGGRVLFVGTKYQSKEVVKKAAEDCGQFYMNHRWPGGLMTNWNTVSVSIQGMKDLEKKIEEGFFKKYKKHEQSKINKKLFNLKRMFSGIKDMHGLPNAIVVTSWKEENIAIREAIKLRIPVVALMDTDADPASIDYPVPGNDDAMKSIEFFSSLCASACLLGIHDEQIKISEKSKEVESKKRRNPREFNRDYRKESFRPRERRDAFETKFVAKKTEPEFDSKISVEKKNIPSNDSKIDEKKLSDDSVSSIKVDKVESKSKDSDSKGE
ncbi:30S ribosomal protein S2 [Candidatus Nesciobacter abundans]|uniref:Small ribosomal subunit protein uS2 n=1 Tax=Candidatus Nesciobacter abundans TaxID=2601668 RepID=A0A5C0UHM9_9PROT|nr:30S ribosomal protein S2 [Candidatus Nesciobacter abundans]QEK39200.1 30S ribosomal protein S2 [Candidatus Nesciobacter abundans]|eukprot:TRINITY_DN15448_c0_g1_i1.p1 TRINITY_DN15448_c0_g1~~TRINITY_DN15448_c0_g1_i1.p1  ORF type:complete len:367 (+),score=-7.26 TRINITY_DN15448_c0_g1_i1:62-1162(+)